MKMSGKLGNFHWKCNNQTFFEKCENQEIVNKQWNNQEIVIDKCYNYETFIEKCRNQEIFQELFIGQYPSFQGQNVCNVQCQFKWTI